MDEKEIWSRAKEELAQTVPTFKMWIEPLEAVSCACAAGNKISA